MTIRSLVVPALLTVAAATLLREAIIRNGVGAIEYVVVALLAAGLLLLAVRLVRRSWSQRPRTSA